MENAYTMTVDVDQSEELANMIKVEAKKTIQLLELFMKMNGNEGNNNYQKDLKEIQDKTNEDMKKAYENFNTYAEETLRSHSQTESYQRNEDDLFEGMDEDYVQTQTTFVTGNGFRDRRQPFSKYVENAIRRNQANYSTEVVALNTLQDQPIIRNNLTNSLENEDITQMRELNRSVNRNKLRIKPNFFTSTNQGKFFKVRLKPLQKGNMMRKKEIINELNKNKQEVYNESID